MSEDPGFERRKIVERAGRDLHPIAIDGRVSRRTIEGDGVMLPSVERRQQRILSGRVADVKADARVRTAVVNNPMIEAVLGTDDTRVHAPVARDVEPEC